MARRAISYADVQLPRLNSHAAHDSTTSAKVLDAVIEGKVTQKKAFSTLIWQLNRVAQKKQLLKALLKRLSRFIRCGRALSIPTLLSSIGGAQYIPQETSNKQCDKTDVP